MKKYFVVPFVFAAFFGAYQVAFGYVFNCKNSPIPCASNSVTTSPVSQSSALVAGIGSSAEFSNSFVAQVATTAGEVYIQEYTDQTNKNICYYSDLIPVNGTAGQMFVNCVPMQ